MYNDPNYRQELPLFTKQQLIKIYPSSQAFKSGKYQLYTIQEIEALFQKHRNIDQFKWTNNPLSEHQQTLSFQKLHIEGFKDKDYRLFCSSDPKDWLMDLSKLALVYIDDYVGYGVVADDWIPQGSWFPFNGEKLWVDPEVYLDYNPYLAFLPCSSDANKRMLINSERIGGFASLLLAAVEAEDLRDVEAFRKQKAENVGLANLSVRLITVNHSWQVGVMAKRHIAPGEMLFSNYEKSFLLQLQGPLMVLNQDASYAPRWLQRDINRKFRLDLIYEGPASSFLTDEVLDIPININKKQLEYQNTNAQRVFIGNEMFIVYPEACRDWLNLARQHYQCQNWEWAERILKITQSLNHRFCLEDRQALDDSVQNLRENIKADLKNNTKQLTP